MIARALLVLAALLAVACGDPPQMDVVDTLYYDPANVHGEALVVAQEAVQRWATQSGVVEITLKPGRPEDGHFLRAVSAERLLCNDNRVIGCQDTNPRNGDAVRIRWSSHSSRSREWQVDTLMHEIGHALSGDYGHADEGLMCENTPHDSAMLGIVDRGLLSRIFGSHGLQIDVSATPEGIPCSVQQQ